MRVVCTSSFPIDLAAAVPGAEVNVPARWVGIASTNLEDADALVCLLLDRIDATVLARAPKLRLIANCAVGYDNIDLEACTRAGVCVTNTPDVLTEATAELTFALMLAAARRIPEGDRLVRSRGWEGWRLDQLIGVQLAGKTLGVIGLGRIGRAVARRAEAFGMHVISAGRERGPGAPPEHGAAMSIARVFAEADVVSLHCPLTPATRHLVNAARLATMKPTAILVNTARGGCVDDGALVAALERGQLFAAALDVFANEPEIDERFYDCPRLVLAPHIGSATTEARIQMARLCAAAVVDVLAGKRPAHLVNPIAWREAPGG